MKRLLIGLVSHKSLVDYRTMLSIEAAVPALLMVGWREQRVPLIGDSDLAGARNTIFSIAYHGGYDKLIFIDVDMSWDQGALERLVLHTEDLVVGAYRKKKDDVEFAVRTIPGPLRCVDPATGEDQPFGLCEIAAGATGFMSISRNCMEKMVEAYGDRWYRYRKPEVVEKAWNVFEFSVTDHERTGEDFHFCDLWRAIGGKVWCDPHITLHHHGESTYSGKFLDHLKEVGRFKMAEAVE